MVYDNVLECIGHTPIIRLNKMVKKGSAEVLVKFDSSSVRYAYSPSIFVTT